MYVRTRTRYHPSMGYNRTMLFHIPSCIFLHGDLVYFVHVLMRGGRCHPSVLDIYILSPSVFSLFSLSLSLTLFFGINLTCVEMFKFEVPSLMVGTLDSLIVSCNFLFCFYDYLLLNCNDESNTHTHTQTQLLFLPIHGKSTPPIFWLFSLIYTIQ